MGKRSSARLKHLQASANAAAPRSDPPGRQVQLRQLNPLSRISHQTAACVQVGDNSRARVCPQAGRQLSGPADLQMEPGRATSGVSSTAAKAIRSWRKKYAGRKGRSDVRKRAISRVERQQNAVNHGRREQ